MGDKNKIIDKHIWRQRLKNLKYVAPIAILFLIAAGYAIFEKSSPVTDRGIIEGVVESIHQGQSATGSDIDHLFVRLENGDLVQVPIARDRGIPFRKFAKIRIEKTEKASGTINYSFREYIQ